MHNGWEPRGRNWYLTGGDGAVLGGALYLGGDTYRAVNRHSTPLASGVPLQGLALVKGAVESHLGVTGAVSDLREIGLQTVYRVRCGDCRTYLGDGCEWLDHKDALRAARDAGWLTRSDLNNTRASRLVRCLKCRGN